MKYIEIQILSTTEASDAIWYLLDEEGAEGVTIEDPFDLLSLRQDETKWDFIEDELIEKLGTDVKIKGYFPAESFDNEKLGVIQHRVKELATFGLDPGKAEITVNGVEEEDWANSWKKFYKPTKIGNGVIIKPSWEPYELGEGEVIVEIDPGMAFGTGTHETTSMCVMLIEKYLGSRKVVFDVGCGSGILGITAAKLGAKNVLCADFDAMACKVAKENAKINEVSTIVEVRCGNLLDIIERDQKADMVVANIIADVIIGFSNDVEQFMEENAIFISSGIIKDRKQDVLDQFAKKQFQILEIVEQGEWVAIAIKKGGVGNA